MAKCAYCGTGILIGGVRDGTLRFCNQTCRREAYLAAASRDVPNETIQQQAQALHDGTCPKCQGAGPVEVHLSHRVHSMLVLTQWQSFTHVSCRKCARKKQLGHLAYSFFLGWWGFPWGLVLTPVQISRNIGAMIKQPAPETPSPALVNAVRRSIGAQVLASEKNAGIPPRQA